MLQSDSGIPYSESQSTGKALKKAASKSRVQGSILDKKPSQDKVGVRAESRAALMAELAIAPAAKAAQTITGYSNGFGELSLTDLIAALVDQTSVANKSQDKRAEAMMAAQAHTLDSIFNWLARTALKSELLGEFEIYLKLSLRAQSQCRATWEAVSAIRNPPMAGYVRQANISQGHQQVNNCSQAPGSRKAPNKLMEDAEHESDQWMDRGTPASAERADSHMEAVAERNRTADTGRKSESFKK